MRSLLLAALVAAAPAAQACSFDDDVSLQRGLLNWAYPDSMHVRAAVWRGEQAGSVRREEFTYRQTAALLRQLRPHVDGNASVLLMTPLLWTRYQGKGASVHADGPARGHDVIVTDTEVVKAIVARRLTMAEALAAGMARLYPTR